MFIKYGDIGKAIIIDVRTQEEFNKGSIGNLNIPIINEIEYSMIKKCYPIAFCIIIFGLIKNRKTIRDTLGKLDARDRRIVIACSRGRLRSPIFNLYCLALGYKSKVLWGGMKPILKWRDNFYELCKNKRTRHN